jgi:F0F1-type ATP synthase assembly protein I
MGATGAGHRPLMGLMTVGIVLVSCIVLGYFLGRYLDGKLGTDPWLSVVGFFLGTAAGFLELFRTVSRNLK